MTRAARRFLEETLFGGTWTLDMFEASLDGLSETDLDVLSEYAAEYDEDLSAAEANVLAAFREHVEAVHARAAR